MTELIIITLIIMVGILLSVVAWQVFSIGKTAVKTDQKSEEKLSKTVDEIKKEIKALKTEFEQLNSRLLKSEK
jgi:cell division protein FtsB